MKSHAKASSVGSNSGRGESRRSLRRPGMLAALLVALMASTCLLPGSAFAIEYRSKTGSFGPDGTSGTTFPELAGPLAFDQGNKRLYELNQETQKIYGFDASTPGSHTPLGGAFPLSAPGADFYDGIAVDSSSHDIYYASRSTDKLYGFSESGSTLPGFPLSVSNPCGVAVDSSGNVWVARGPDGAVSKYNSGVLLESITIQGAASEPCHIAVDNEENLFLANDFFGVTTEYVANDEYVAATSKVIDSEFPYAIGIDHATGELFVVHYEFVSVYDESTGTLLYEFGEVPGGEYYGEFGGIAIDEASEEAYVSNWGDFQIDLFGAPLSVPRATTEGADAITAGGATLHGKINPKGQAVEDCHFEVVPASQFIPHEVQEEYEPGKFKPVTRKEYEQVTPAQKFPCVPAAGSIPVDSEQHPVSANVTGLNPATVYHYRLVAKNSIGEGAGFDRQFTSGPTAPLVEAQSVEAVGATDATVAAKINPRGGETTYHVEYGTTTAYGQSTEESAPFGFPSDNSKHSVSVHIIGLEAGTAYHFRFVATNGVGTTDGTDKGFATYTATEPGFAPCPNDRFRTGAGGRLPDCRAYEQASPIDKHGAGAQIQFGRVGASVSGDRVTFYAKGGLPTSGGDTEVYLASRGPGGWSTDSMLPVRSPDGAANIASGLLSEDFSAALISATGPEYGPGGARQLLLRDNDTASFEPVGLALTSVFEVAKAVGFAADTAHVVFDDGDQLLPGAPAGKYSLYDYNHGTLTLASRIPAGSATSCDDEAGPACIVAPEGLGDEFHVNRQSAKISRDGSRLFFTISSPGQTLAGRIYMREGGTRTSLISASQRTTPDPGGEKPARLVGITPDGSKAFFVSCEKLTDDSTAHSTAANSCESASQGQDLYVYDANSGELTDLTVDSEAGDPLGAAVPGFAGSPKLLGASEDGSYAYFLAAGVLAPGAPAGSAIKIYLSHDGATTLVATIGSPSELTEIGDGARVAADGKTLAFSSSKPLTGYDNVGPCGNGGTTRPCNEFFRYSAPEEELLCLTCLPTGTPPSAGASVGNDLGGINGAAESASGDEPPRNLSADGNRFFFDTKDPLVPRDTNGVTDVYEWEAKGSGSCESESQNGGCIYLISSGTDPVESGFLDASKNGDHVFFLTEQQLVPSDEDVLYDVYDAGVGAGLASQHTLAPASCASTACQANPAPPPDPSLASAAYAGAGNVHPAAKGRKCPKGKRKVRSGGKVSCRKAHRQHKRHNNRGGSK